MTVRSTLARARRRAESVMIDTCTITRAGTGASTWDEETETTVPPARTTVYTGRCLVMARDVSGSEIDLADQEVSTRAYVVSVPVSVTGAAVGDRVHVDASTDPAAAGRDLVVDSIDAVTVATMRRLFCTYQA